MVNVNVDISDELMMLIRRKDINIKEVVERSLWEEALWNEAMERIASKSKLTEKDAEEIGNKIKHSIAKRHGL